MAQNVLSHIDLEFRTELIFERRCFPRRILQNNKHFNNIGFSYKYSILLRRNAFNLFHIKIYKFSNKFQLWKIFFHNPYYLHYSGNCVLHTILSSSDINSSSSPRPPKWNGRIWETLLRFVEVVSRFVVLPFPWGGQGGSGVSHRRRRRWRVR